MVGQVGAFGIGIITLEAVLFVSALIYGRKVTKDLRPLLRGLSASLREFDDKFGDEESLVTRARTRYRRSLRHIEAVDARLVSDSALSESEAARVFGRRMSYSQFEHVYKSIPTILVTLGLLGTFVGLASNLSELALILDATQNSPAGALLRASRILEPMATAFLTSLVGVALSILLWFIGNAQGTQTIVDDTRELISAYLDQVIQANSKRYSLLKESVDRMEGYLADFLSNFSDRVGLAIDKAMNLKIGQVFDSIKESSETYSTYVKLLDEGSRQLNQSASVFFQASTVFRESDFASEFGEATTKFILSTDNASRSLSTLIDESRDLEDSLKKTRETIEQGADICTQILTTGSESMRELSNASSSMQSANGSVVEASSAVAEAAKQLREARLAIGRDARANEKLTTELSKALLDIATLTERVTTLTGTIQDGLPNQYASVLENVKQIKSAVDYSLQSLVSINTQNAENLQKSLGQGS